VVSIDGDTVTVKNDKGMEWRISKDILAAEACRSKQFTKTEKVTRTELARVLEQDVRDCAFFVCFTKLPDVNDQEALLNGADLGTPAKRKRVACGIGGRWSRSPEPLLQQRHASAAALSAPLVRFYQSGSAVGTHCSPSLTRI